MNWSLLSCFQQNMNFGSLVCTNSWLSLFCISAWGKEMTFTPNLFRIPKFTKIKTAIFYTRLIMPLILILIFSKRSRMVLNICPTWFDFVTMSIYLRNTPLKIKIFYCFWRQIRKLRLRSQLQQIIAAI